jgi:uncharacterized metal-binding protein
MSDMTPECAMCPTQVCRLGKKTGVPEPCPMLQDFPEYARLYGCEEARRLAFSATLIESKGYRRWTRVRELLEFCRMMNFSSVGLAYCPDMAFAAKLLGQYLTNNGIHASFPELRNCDPVGLADQFSCDGTQLNVLAGMCVGHDALFVRNSRALVTAVVARDTVLQHNPAAALYLSQGYFRNALYTEHRLAATDTQNLSHKDLLRIATEISTQGLGRWTRIEEFIEFAQRIGARKLGLVFCHGLREEAKILVRILEANGYQVVSIGCKAGAIPKEALGIADHQKVRPGEPEMICNPLAQAEILNCTRTDLNALLGQCVGHDAATISALKAPTVSLVVKDRVLAHNTIAALWSGKDTRDIASKR